MQVGQLDQLQGKSCQAFTTCLGTLAGTIGMGRTSLGTQKAPCAFRIVHTFTVLLGIKGLWN